MDLPSYCCWTGVLLGEALKAQRLGRAEQTQEGKCMYIKKWILAQT